MEKKRLLPATLQKNANSKQKEVNSLLLYFWSLISKEQKKMLQGNVTGDMKIWYLKKMPCGLSPKRWAKLSNTFYAAWFLLNFFRPLTGSIVLCTEIHGSNNSCQVNLEMYPINPYYRLLSLLNWLGRHLIIKFISLTWIWKVRIYR